MPRSLLETLAPAGRLLRDALNKQVLLETVILKAMREAHAVKLDDVLRQLNRLRSAGELKFLDQAPPVQKNERPAAAPEVSPPTPKPEVKPEPPKPAPPKPAPAPEAKPKPVADLEIELVRPAVKPAPAPEVKPEVKPAPAPEAKPKPVAKPAAKPASTPTASPDGKRRVSIANSDPQAVRNAAKNDPAVGRLAELFDGDVIDIHRPEAQ